MDRSKPCPAVSTLSRPFRLRRTRLPRAAAGVALLLFAILCGPPDGSARAADTSPQRLEVEEYILKENVGGEPIVEVFICGTSEGLAVRGFDTAGDRIDLKLEVTRSFCFVDSLLGAALKDQAWQFDLQIFPAGSATPAVEELYPEVPGEGVGCPPAGRFSWAVSPGVHCLDAGTYTVRLTRVGDGEAALDCLDLKEIAVPVEAATWGDVKRLFR